MVAGAANTATSTAATAVTATATATTATTATADILEPDHGYNKFYQARKGEATKRDAPCSCHIPRRPLENLEES